MKIEVLISALDADVPKVINCTNLRTNALMINQSYENSYEEIIKNGNKIRVFNSTTRGLSRSRNLAFLNSIGDILLICDDDVEYVDNYEDIILEAFDNLPTADMVIFNIERINFEGIPPKDIIKIKNKPMFKTYGSVRIAIKSKSFFDNELSFSNIFGAGSTYTSGEDSILLRDAQRKNMNVFLYPKTIAKVDFSHSTWRSEPYKKILEDKGALIARAYPRPSFIFIVYMAYKMRNKDHNFLFNYKQINSGVKKFNII